MTHPLRLTVMVIAACLLAGSIGATSGVAAAGSLYAPGARLVVRMPSGAVIVVDPAAGPVTVGVVLAVSQPVPLRSAVQSPITSPWMPADTPPPRGPISQPVIYDPSAWEANRSDQQNLDVIAAPLAWQEAEGAGQVVAVIDSGVDGTHPDLQGRLVDGYDVREGVIAPAGGSNDVIKHGTHVAGTIAAAINRIGISGVAPGARIMAVKVFPDSNDGTSADVAAGILWAVGSGATVINLSLVIDGEDPAVAAAVDLAVQSGITVVAAVGNFAQDGNALMPPASYPGVMGIGSVERDLSASVFSETGSQVDLMAPGGQILSTVPGGNWAWLSGTSMAAPHVAAAAAVLRSRAGATPALVDAALMAGARDMGVTAGRDDETGMGLMNLAASMRALDASLGTTGVVARPLAATTTVIRLGSVSRRGGGASYNLTALSRSAGAAIVGAPILLQHKAGGAWATIARAVTNESGRVMFALAIRGTTRLRVLLPASELLAKSVSATVVARA
jgi:subtilisin family serine protease